VPAEARRLKAAVPASPQAIEAGKVLYGKYCRACHGEDATGGRGNGKIRPSNLTDKRWDRGSREGEIFWVIQNGAPPAYHMRGFKGTLSDENIWNVVHYVRSLGGVTR
jgi:cytochrome c oxidase cbb3-type subunit 3